MDNKRFTQKTECVVPLIVLVYVVLQPPFEGYGEFRRTIATALRRYGSGPDIPYCLDLG